MSVPETEGVYVLQTRIGSSGSWVTEAVFERYEDCEARKNELRERYLTKRTDISIRHSSEGYPTRFVPAGGEPVGKTGGDRGGERE